MANLRFIRCPVCGEKFKSSREMEGKKVRCPECDEPFRITAAMMSVPTEPKIAGADAAGRERKRPDERIQKHARPILDSEEEEPPTHAAHRHTGGNASTGNDSLPDDSDLDEDGNPYGMTEVKVAPRCPSCAMELVSEKDTICLNCGYNLMTREVGTTKKLYELTPQEHLAHLAPALGSLGFAFIWMLVIMFFCLFLPRFLPSDGIMSWLDSEAVRLFFTVPSLLLIYWAGNYGLQHVIFKPKPEEREKD